MKLMDSIEFCELLDLPHEPKKVGEKAPVPSGLQRAYRMAAEPERFGLPRDGRPRWSDNPVAPRSG
jgi:hypothetical protein